MHSNKYLSIGIIMALLFIFQGFDCVDKLIPRPGFDKLMAVQKAKKWDNQTLNTSVVDLTDMFTEL